MVSQYPQVIQCIFLIFCQFLLAALRTMNTQYIISGSISETISSGIGYQIIWLISTSIGVKAVMDGDLILVLSFILGWALGTIFILRFKNKRRWF